MHKEKCGPVKQAVLIFDVTTDKPIISLFSGAMGLDLGLEAAGSGLRTAVALELNHFAAETIRLNRPNLPVINRSIQKVKTEEILKLARLKVGEAFLVTGGPCCQSFSTAGKRESLSDKDRGGLFRHFKRVVRGTRPRFFLMENVKGILSAAVLHRPLNKRGPGWPPLSRDEELGSALRVIRGELADLGYYVIFGLLNCADYGVPQKRYRVVFIGSRDGELIEFPKPTHAESANGKPKWTTLRHALDDLNEKTPEFFEFSSDRLGFLKQLRAGQNWTNLPKRLQSKALGAAYKSWGGRCGFCRRLDWDKPSPTLTTAPGGRATTLCHPSKLRPLTIGEYARLQQFPSNWKFVGSTQQKYVQIGNAVPTGLGCAIGKALLKTVRLTAKRGVPADSKKRLGRVVCADPELDTRLQNRPKTMLHPPRLRKNPDSAAARRWILKTAA
jgi:DNA (cytosine-5)-methyltransferase 1